MRAHQIMTKDVTTVTPHTSIRDAASIMLKCHFSGLPVVDDSGSLVGMVSQSDFLRRAETGTVRKRTGILQLFSSAGKLANEFVHEHGRKVQDVMTTDVLTIGEQTTLSEIVALMEKHDVKRLPVMSGKILAGIVTRTNLLQAVASMARDVPDPTADDDHIRDRITRTVHAADWRPAGFQATVRDGVVHLHGVIFDDSVRQATIVAAENVAGVKEVHDHLCYVDSYSGFYVESPEDMKAAS
ncbi:MAG: CBS domain-containing protein [bacterium]|nr:CBS domain-containing protein [bacterium]